ncbi:MAG: aminotransferase class V-fold PLP-dependent enzyme, partial [Sedimentisphaerales bacterium]|nr:aminotransferase class V-fold PLP-dependent enzyme [Sedimentisphaerales bacterium]
AATSFPKPPAVLEAITHYATKIGASAGRGAYREALQAQDILHTARSHIARLIHVPDPDAILMTFNCTDGLSLAIKGALTKPRQHVVATNMEHNSVLRPLHALQEQLDLDITWVPADPTGLVDPDAIRRALRPDTRLVCLVHASNVCGAMNDIYAVGDVLKDHPALYLVDAAQTIGHLPLDASRAHVDMLAFPGHKSLLGPLGTGALYLRPGLETDIRPLKEGGTGSRSEVPTQPDFLPDRYESGSHNLLGIAGLAEGVAWVLKRTPEQLRNHERRLMQAFLDGTKDCPGLTVYGPKDIDHRVGVFSVAIEGYSPTELAAVLEEQFGLLTRPGLHCAPFAHRTLGTLDAGGTTRFSFGPFLQVSDVQNATNALHQIAGAPIPGA